MISTSRRIISILVVTVASLGASRGSVPYAGTAEGCKLEYQRADNMWAAAGRPDGNLGVEMITLQPGQTKVFVTDWKHEKMRNDGKNYYGSHLRVASNGGQSLVRLNVKLRTTAERWVTLYPGETKTMVADLMEVSCPSKS